MPLWTDQLGRELRPPLRPERIVSLVPSLTELLFELCCGARIVGVSDYCVHPAQALLGVARVGGQKDPDLERLLSLHPDLVIANKEENREKDVAALERAAVPVYVTDVRTLEVALALPQALGQVCAADAGQVAQVARRMREGVSLAREMARRRGRSPRVVMPVWKDPWIVAGGDTYIDDVLCALGAENAARDLQGPGNRRYPKTSLAELRALGPGLVLLPSEPYPFSPEDAAALSAALDGVAVKLCDGTLASWYGPRTGRIHELCPLLDEAIPRTGA